MNCYDESIIRVAMENVCIVYTYPGEYVTDFPDSSDNQTNG